MRKKIRKKIAILMTLLLCLSMADFSALITAYAEETEEIAETADSIDENMDDTLAEKEGETNEGVYSLTYEVKDGNAVITGYTGELPSELVLPGTIDGYTVTEIGENAFAGADIVSVVILDGVTTIGGRAFDECKQLVSVQIPDSVTVIEHSAFHGTSSLKTILIPENVSHIGGGAFDYSGISEIYFSGDAPEYSYIFDSRDSLLLAFYPEDNLTWTEDTMEYGDQIQWVPWNPETGETKKFEYSYGEYTLMYIGDDGNATIIGYTGELPSELVLPDTIDGYAVTEISHHVFEDADITSVVIPDGVTAIRGYAFDSCKQLVSARIPNSVVTIEGDAFVGCSSLESISISDGVTTIEPCTFSGCESLTEVLLPDSLQIIGFGAFEGCSSLVSVRIPDSVTLIEFWAFEDCTSLERINIPEGITSIGDNTFSGCESLSEISLPSSLQSIYAGAFYGCKKLTSLQIPASVTYIDEAAFSQSGISEIYFSGNVPEFEYEDIFTGDTLTAFYPADNLTWTEEVMQPYGADNIEWIPWDPETEEIQGSIDVVDDSVDGENEIGVHIIGSGDDLVLECNLPLQYFVSVEIDGVTVDQSNYELKSGSTVITFDSSFLDTLTPGNHTVTMHYNINGRKVAVKTTITIRKTSEPSGKPSKPDKPSKPAEPSKPANGNSTGTDNETAAASQNKVTMKAHLVDANGQPMYNCTLEIHSKPVSATLGTDGTACFKDIEVGDHTMYLKDQNGKVLASKAIKIIHDKTYSITGGDTIHVVKGRAFILNVKYDGENLILLSVEGDQTPETGDTSSAKIWILLMAISFAGAVSVFKRMRKQKQ